MNSQYFSQNTSHAVLSGGCFWGMEHLFSQLEGVHNVTTGYTGGSEHDACYERVKTGETSHAEAIKIIFFTDKISYEDILKFFFKIHNPTTLYRQGNDMGYHYRSCIFYDHAEQKEEAEQLIKSINNLKVFDSPIVTSLESLTTFYQAEEYHQNHLTKYPQGYTCHRVRKNLSF